MRWTSLVLVFREKDSHVIFTSYYKRRWERSRIYNISLFNFILYNEVLCVSLNKDNFYIHSHFSSLEYGSMRSCYQNARVWTCTTWQWIDACRRRGYLIISTRSDWLTRTSYTLSLGLFSATVGHTLRCIVLIKLSLGYFILKRGLGFNRPFQCGNPRVDKALHVYTLTQRVDGFVPVSCFPLY